MSKFQNYLKTFDITSTLTEEDIEKTMALLQIYGPTVRRTAARIDEFEEECYESRRQSISDFINLAIDYDRDTDRKRISDRLAEMGHCMELLSVMEEALVLVKGTPPNGGTYGNDHAACPNWSSMRSCTTQAAQKRPTSLAATGW